MRMLKNNATILMAFAVLLVLDRITAATGWNHSYYYKILIDVGIAAILAVSLNLINGITGQFSLGHAGFMALGAYVAASFSSFVMKPWVAHMHWTGGVETAALGIGAGIAIVLGGITAAMAGLIVGIPTLRLRGDYLAIATLGFGEIIRILILNTEAVGGPRGMGDIPTNANFFWVYGWMLACVVMVSRLVYSVKGKAFFAIREDEFAASMIGIDITRYKVLAFLTGSFFAGVAGGLFAHSATGFIVPGEFDTLKSIEIVVMVVLGGLGSISGSLIAAAVLTILPEALRQFSDYRMVAYSLLLIIMMLTRPQGLMGMRELTFPRRRPSTPA